MGAVTSESTPVQDEIESAYETHDYNGYFAPRRKLFLMGFDADQNPGFVVLVGEQEFDWSGGTVSAPVVYINYTIFSWRKGHFPSFDTPSISDDYNYSTRESSFSME